jgi:hypothetical protein
VVEEVDPGVTTPVTGSEVYAMLGYGRDGAEADSTIALLGELVLKPGTLDHVQAAAVPLSALTAWQALFDHASLVAGQKIANLPRQSYSPLRQRIEEDRLGLGTDLEDAYAPHIQQVVSPDLCHTHEHRVAGLAAYDCPHAMHVGGNRLKGIGGVATCTGGLDERHIKGEDHLQHAPGGVTL